MVLRPVLGGPGRFIGNLIDWSSHDSMTAELPARFLDHRETGRKTGKPKYRGFVGPTRNMT